MSYHYSSPPPPGFFYAPSGRLLRLMTKEEIDQARKRENDRLAEIVKKNLPNPNDPEGLWY